MTVPAQPDADQVRHLEALLRESAADRTYGPEGGKPGSTTTS